MIKTANKFTFLSQNCAIAVLLGVSVLKLQAQSAPAWSPQSDQFRFHMIGGAHIDPVWLWPWSEGVSVVHSTFRSTLDRMNEDPNVMMTTSS
ncbi:MAG: hypothetical protein P4L87_00100, partial [Formivibrio sp.]|nr:hypothetical protein [Formivibrio sp.]